MESFQVYKDMKARTNGEIYIGVVGPVRTGKSTFIKRFMDLRYDNYDYRTEVRSERGGGGEAVR